MFPQVNGGAAHVHQLAVCRGGEAQLRTVGCQALGTEPTSHIRAGLGLGGGRSTSLGPAKLLLEFEHLAAQLGDGSSMLGTGLLEAFDLRSNLLAGHTSDFGSEDGSDICHRSILLEPDDQRQPTKIQMRVETYVEGRAALGHSGNEDVEYELERVRPNTLPFILATPIPSTPGQLFVPTALRRPQRRSTMTQTGPCKENSRFSFVCSKRWAELGETARRDVRHCASCNTSVFKVDTGDEHRVASALGRCIAMRSLDSMDLVLGNAGVGWNAPAEPARSEVSVMLPRSLEPGRLDGLQRDFPKLFRAPSPPSSDGQIVQLGTFEPGELTVLLDELAARGPELVVLINGAVVEPG